MRLALFGYGRMGRAVEAVALERGHEVALRLDGAANPDGAGVTPDALRDVDVAVDFSVGDAVARNVEGAAAQGVDVVVGTTGWEGERERVFRAVEDAGVGLLHAPNFSTGVHLFLRLAALAGDLAGAAEGYDVHAIDAHHRHKRDHPSGTARRLAELLVERVPGKERWSADLPADGPIPPDLLHVAVSRLGEEAGSHAVILDGPDDRIEVRHTARGRTGFARGAVVAAEWIRGRRGIHTMDDLLRDRLGEGGSDDHR